ncbi:3-dehydroquinate dehydratase (3-dehydroquinase) [Gonapodya sp. JEL0774]|nr:3-dehydroquinate dehydratase (3-dehydroquinase) [Gonapodya sp. JEL0774]
MKQRPIGDLVDALNANGCKIAFAEKKGSLPLVIQPTGFPGGKIALSANISSQYVSAILMAAPYAETPVELTLTGEEVVSQAYIDMTLSIMEDFGVKVERLPDGRSYRVPRSTYTNPANYSVEADASSATYPLAFAAVTGTTVTVTNMGSRSLQGDSRFATEVLAKFGCVVEQTERTTTVTGPPFGQLKGIGTIDMEPMTDAFLTLCAVAAVAVGDTTIVGIANQRVKECDRIAAMCEQLKRFGVKVTEMPTGLTVHGAGPEGLHPPEGPVKCYDDHRVAMSMSVLSMGLTEGLSTVIGEKRCVEKTWPDWWDVVERELGVVIDGVDEMLPLEDEDVSGAKKEAAVVPKDGPSALSAVPYAGTSALVSGLPTNLSNATIVVIGMRGAGKTTLGSVAAKKLHRLFVDLDALLEQRIDMTIHELIEKKGWEGFREAELETLRFALDKYPSGAILACGGGIVETEGGREALKEWCGKKLGLSRKGHVLHLTRDIEDVIDYLSRDKTRPAFPEEMKDVWTRRKGWYSECSTIEFVVVKGKCGVVSVDLEDESYWEDVTKELILRLTHHLTLPGSNDKLLPGGVPLPPNTSYFLALTFGDVRIAIPSLEEVTRGADAVELRVDLLDNHTPEFVGEQVAILRRNTDLPIIFTVRTTGQGGKYPGENVEGMFELLKMALKWGCEFVDLEVVGEDDPARKALMESVIQMKGNSKIIASFHDFNGTVSWDDISVASPALGNLAAGQALRDSKSSEPVVTFPAKYKVLEKYGDILKLIGMAKHRTDNHALERFVIRVTGPSFKPLIALNMGLIGQETRALNTFITPVTHLRLPVPAAPGQLSIAQINQLRHLLGVLPEKHFFLFGSPIAHSQSPTIHNTGFKELGLPYTYKLSETTSWTELQAVIEEHARVRRFGGGSVTIPLKEDVVRYGVVDELSDAAKRIGAVNTLVAVYGEEYGEKGYRIVGDNTDWLGIRRSVWKRLGSSAGGLGTVGVVIGGGGTSRAACYALKQMECEDIRIWNRTLAKAEHLAAEFGGTVIRDLKDALKSLRNADDTARETTFVIVGTIPAQAQNGLDFPGLFSEPNPFKPVANGALLSEHVAAVDAKGLPLAGIPSRKPSASGVVVDMAYRPRRTSLLTQAISAEAIAVGWNFSLVEGIEILCEQGFEQFARWTGRKAPVKRIEAAVYHEYRE